jgi:hypothetical protein
MLPSASPLGWVLAGVMGATAVYHLVRLVPTLRSAAIVQVDVDLVHAAMGLAMAAMFLGLLGRTASVSGAVAFLLATLWFSARGLRAPRLWPQALASAAMLYMLAGASSGAMPVGAPVLGGHGPGAPSGSMAGMSDALAGPARLAASPLLDAAFLVLMVGLVLWTYRELDRAHAARVERMGVGCQLATNVGAVVMLLLML